MRILHVISTFLPAFAFGGPPKVTFDLCKELVKKGHDVWVYTTNAYNQKSNFKPKNRTIMMKGIKVTYFSNILRLSNIYIAPKIITEMRKFLKTFDVVHVHFGRQLYDIYIGLTAAKFRVPYVVQAHGCLAKTDKRKILKGVFDNSLGRKILRNSAKTIALNNMEAEQYRRMGVPEEKIVIIPNGIDLSEYANLPPKGLFKKKFGIHEDKKIILYLGRIHKTKGIDFLVKAYAYLVKKMNFKDAVLVIAGPDDGYLNEAKALANSLKVYNSIIFTGFISSEDKLGVLVDATVFVTPSFYGFPMTFLEACAVGTPIITTSLGDTLEWIDNKVGYITRPTLHDFAEAIYRIISNDGLCKRFSKNCKDIIRFNFSLEKVVARLEKVYREVVEK
ncbi:MAG: glycosyltransferase [Candidatus Baldrarchaeia archaeon]